ncbi:uncharacterized protein LOC110019901 [Phalaenopsis equestris]|uniref:uncharacterized protein LOC110019901 n=1 Tax=Phalaenopsis equestris TaxID=78828 RepID=UPI0009E1FBBD|nr:uncharacterized protein LOC110019901 [Phalaenopsis equestris]XP_020573427.1 uncharacterized protein LOC110019901 [Phalaenopsis equestris]XP_020573428.1 uncharacterized protein LOC110019901 [Phalaenopsis equestris]
MVSSLRWLHSSSFYCQRFELRRTQGAVRDLRLLRGWGLSYFSLYPSPWYCFPAKLLLRLHHRNRTKPLVASGFDAVESLPRLKMFCNSDLKIHDRDEFVSQLQELLTQVKSMIKSGNKEDAIHVLQANYETVKEQVDDGHVGIEQAAILDTLALGYMDIGDMKTVVHLLNLLKSITSCVEDDQPLLDSILMHMGSMSLTNGKFDDAALMYERCLKILEKEFGDDNPFLITPLMGRAKVFRLTGRISKAIAIYDRAIKLLEKNRGVESEELVVPLFGLGDLYISEGKAGEAESCFSRILCIYQKLYGETDAKVGIALSSLARAKCAKGEIKEAINLYKSGLQIINESKYLNLDDDLLEKMRVDLAELLHTAGREHEGREVLKECLLINEKYKGIEHPNSVGHLLSLAASYSRSKNYSEAERLLRTCLHYMSRTVEPGGQSITVPMLHLAVTLYHLKEDEEAENLALEVVQIREKLFGKESLPVGEALDCLVSIQTRLEREDRDILAKLKRILSIQETEFGYDSEDYLMTLKKVLFYLDKMGLYDEKFPLQRSLQSLKIKFKQSIPV